jgi:hypothetical protein
MGVALWFYETYPDEIKIIKFLMDVLETRDIVKIITNYYSSDRVKEMIIDADRIFKKLNHCCWIMAKMYGGGGGRGRVDKYYTVDFSRTGSGWRWE